MFINSKFQEKNMKDIYRNSTILPGDSVRIVYDNTNPDYSMTVRAYYSSVYLQITGF